MSRTDVHRPWRVQVADPHDRHLFYRFAAWPWQMDLISIRNLCGCNLCTGQASRKQTARKSRHDTRLALRDLVAQAAAGELDEDAPLLRRRHEVW